MQIYDGKNYDVVVCGCGSAGFCAAVQAARLGMKVAVVEKYASPGGILTVLGNNSIDQFNNPFRSENKMVISGIGWEFVKKLNRAGYAHIPDMDAPYKNHSQYGVKVNPVAAAKFMDDMLLAENIDLYYDQALVSADTSGKGEKIRIVSAVITSKRGLTRLYSKVFIDCTGDGDLCAWAGADFECGDDSNRVQPGTLRFYPCADRRASPEKRIISDKWRNILYSGGDNCNHVTKYNSADSDMKTHAEIRARDEIYSMMERLRNDGAPIEIQGIAPAAAPRESRRITGDSHMSFSEYASGKIFEDSICYSFWFVDIHNDDTPTTIRYITDGATPTVRLSAMVPEKLYNVFTAGRCVSTDRETNSALRVKASCMAMGQAAGAAAALSARYEGDVRAADIGTVRQTLANAGAIVPGINGFLSFRDALR